MCLCSSQIMPAKARKDIVCYKLMRHKDKLGRLFETPYQFMDMTLGRLYHAHPWRIKKVPRTWFCKQTYITDGYIHAYTTKRPMFIIDNSLVFMECIIPKGTLYYKSIDGNEVCAKSLKLVKVVK